MTVDIAAYGGLFAAALIAATILPAQSEAVLVGLILAGGYSTPLLVAVASLGNVLGSVINWGLGRGIERVKTARWFPASVAQMEAAERWYRRYGLWSLLASWVPVIGDPLTVIAGVLKVRLLPFLLLVTIAKTGRYIVLALLVTVWA